MSSILPKSIYDRLVSRYLEEKNKLISSQKIEEENKLISSQELEKSDQPEIEVEFRFIEYMGRTSWFAESQYPLRLFTSTPIAGVMWQLSSCRPVIADFS